MLFSFYNFISFSVHFWCWLKGPLSPRADNLCFMAVSVIAGSWSRVQKYTHINIWTEKRKSDVGQGRNACISTNNATRGNLTLNQDQARSPCPCTTCPVVTSARIDSKEPGHSRSRDPGCPARGHTGSPRASLRCPLLGQDHSRHSLCAEQGPSYRELKTWEVGTSFSGHASGRQTLWGFKGHVAVWLPCPLLQGELPWFFMLLSWKWVQSGVRVRDEEHPGSQRAGKQSSPLGSIAAAGRRCPWQPGDTPPPVFAHQLSPICEKMARPVTWQPDRPAPWEYKSGAFSRVNH